MATPEETLQVTNLLKELEDGHADVVRLTKEGEESKRMFAELSEAGDDFNVKINKNKDALHSLPWTFEELKVNRTTIDSNLVLLRKERKVRLEKIRHIEVIEGVLNLWLMMKMMLHTWLM